jgi:hypothetical protein
VTELVAGADAELGEDISLQSWPGAVAGMKLQPAPWSSLAGVRRVEPPRVFVSESIRSGLGWPRVAALLRVVEVELGQGLTGAWGLEPYVTPIVERTCGMPKALANCQTFSSTRSPGVSGRMTSNICFR